MLLETCIKGFELKFETSDNIFSPRGIDKGTLAMLSVVDFQLEDRVLDLGCGYGVVGILAAKIVGSNRVAMVDIDPSAVELAEKNAVLNNVEGINAVVSDGFKSIRQKDFTIILSNPPYHTDFSVAKEFIEKGFNRLVISGKMYMVTKRKEWYKNKLLSIFGGVKIWEVDGYFIFMAEKKGCNYANAKKRQKTKKVET